VDRNRKPAIAAIAQTALRLAPANGTLRKNRRSIMGSAWWGSYASSTASAATDSAKKARISGERQPSPGPSMMA
jgi:hypothetical protein